MNRKKFAALALVPLVLVLAACAPTAGTVHNKRYSPATSSFSCHSSSTHSCSGYSSGPEYDLDLYTADGKHGWRSVTESEYESVGVGDYFDGKAAQ